MGTLFLVTGATGHLGNTIIQKLISGGEKVRALVLDGDKLANNLPAEVELCVGDVSNIKTLSPFFDSRGNDLIVIHCAGIISISSGKSKKIYDTNVNGTRNIVELCNKHHVKKLVYVSSVHALPVLPHGKIMFEVSTFSPKKVKGTYAKTKAEATALVLDAASQGLNVSIVHPSGIIGPFDHGCSPMTALFLHLSLKNLPACVTGGYDFVDVRDVAEGIISCCHSGRNGECYILSGNYIPVFEIVKAICKEVGTKTPKIIPIWLAKIAAPFSELYSSISHKPSLFTSYSLYTLSSNAVFSYKKAERELGYKPRPFLETVSDTVAWLRNQKRMVLDPAKS